MRKQWLHPRRVILILSILTVSVFIYYQYYRILHKSPIWQVEGIPDSKKLKIAKDNFSLFWGGSEINYIYFLRPDQNTTFLVLESGLILGVHQLYYDGDFVSTTYCECELSMFSLAKTAHGQFWVLYSPRDREYLRDESISLICRNAADSNISTFNLPKLLWDRDPKYAPFLEALDQGYTSGSWRFFMLFSKSMLLNNKLKYADLINRYANHDFTPEERLQNAKSEIPENDVVIMAKKMKEKYKL